MTRVRYISLHENSGYGVAARRVMRGLLARGVELTWTPMVPGQGWRLGYEPFVGRTPAGAGELARYCNRPLDYDVAIVHTVPEYFPLWRDVIAAERGARMPLVVGHTVWETTSLPPHWPGLIESVDALLVPCAWNRDLFEAAGYARPIHLLPHPCSESLSADSAPRPSGAPFRFYSINTWTLRKALDLLLRAYWTAFEAKDPVELVLKTSPEDFTRPRGRMARRLFGAHTSRAKLEALRRDFPNAAAVRLISDDLSDAQMQQMHREGDCYVSLARSEGWGLGAFDAATSGVPIVMTGFGGQLEYLQPDESYFVDYREVPVIDPNAPGSYAPEGRWAEPDLASAARCMREVFEAPQEARRRALVQAERIRARFSSEPVAERLVRDLDALLQTSGGGRP